ncbi:MAG: transglycosylase SLT domain-containing protein, partial [Candidatus Micrarchaeaceae archaeon]
GWETDSNGNSRYVTFYAFADNTSGYYIPGQAPQQNSLAAKLAWMEGLVAQNNSSGQPDSIPVCMAWKESGFNPKAFNGRGGGFGAIGLFQVRKITLTDFNRTWLAANAPPYTKDDLWNPTLNTYIATAEMYQHIEYAGGNVIAGINSLGTGSGYSDSIMSCSRGLPSEGTAALKR